ncbi:tetratricopeptide repeat protein [Marinobacter sp. TBZ242]|uniref:Tetratricopeptide repeat protein n=1 Tax=Marinobacter azerbaijanicus TaxID=3050455 RepID=A0ABT7IE88_9GAMM|nr:tetratricopeptide repeat protein [Marinobacter sp. TBZ242]MDL0432481.1 tetratricopeptide repeat protein [Marinobacter sp. TBZ242]
MQLSRFVIFIALVIWAPALMAKDSAEHPDFQAGVEAFSKGELAQARAYFERARADGLSNPSLLYNLGVVYFRLGQYGPAESVFRELLDTPHGPLAKYNLGLVKRAAGQNRAARQWFEQAAGPDSPEKVRALALRQLDEAEPRRRRDVNYGSGYFSVVGGYDDNIAGTPDDASSNQAGGFVDLLSVGNLRVGTGGVSLHGVAYTRQYPSHDEFDNSYLSTGASWLKEVGAGELTSTVSLAGSWFGGEVLERQIRLEAAYTLDNCVLNTGASEYDCTVTGSVSAIDGGSGFSAYDGKMLRVGASAEKGMGSWVFRGQYQLEVNDRTDLATQQEFFSVSPIRNLVSAEARYYVSTRLSFAARADVRYSRYRDDHLLLSGTDVNSERRTDRRLRGLALVEYRLAGRWRVLAEWSMLNNRSTIERYDYSRREAMVGVEVGF